jgi:hypothetical protein
MEVALDEQDREILFAVVAAAAVLFFYYNFVVLFYGILGGRYFTTYSLVALTCFLFTLKSCGI